MKTLILLACLVLLAGCTLNRQVPKAQISFNPRTHSLDILSHKDVVLSNVVVRIDGTNTSISIGYYAAQANIEIIKAAITAQQQQIQGVQQGLQAIVGAAIDHAKP